MDRIDWTTIGPILAGLAAILALGLPIAQFMRTGRLARAAEEASKKAALSVVQIDVLSGRVDGTLAELKALIAENSLLKGREEGRAEERANPMSPVEPKS